MVSEIKSKHYPNGELQRYQVVTLDSWQQLEFFQPKAAPEALDCFRRIYQKFLVPACPVLFGTMVLFRLPQGMDVPFSYDTKAYGRLAEPLTAAAAGLEQGLYFLGKKPCFRDEMTRKFYTQLEEQNCIRIVRGWLPITTIIPVSERTGFLTESEESAQMKVDANFFIMDRFDCATAFDHVGIPFGLRVKEGLVEDPPAYGREALLVKQDGSVTVRPVDIRELELVIGGKCYRHGENAQIFDRPRHFRTPNLPGKKAVIVGRKVVALSTRRFQRIPTAGFLLCLPPDSPIQVGDAVTYRGLEDIVFGIQVGNSILKSGVKTEKFLSKFYNIRHFQPIPYPPSLYPMDFHKSRAARIALGANSEGNPMVLWAEGAGKLRYLPGQDSCGASLSELAELCCEAGMVNAVNLDGGGSAQILLHNKRSLLISDRREEDNTECERPVPMALIVR